MAKTKSKKIQKKSEVRRLNRQWGLLCKRAQNWYEGGKNAPNIVMMYLQGGELRYKEPSHMLPFCEDETVQTKFRDVALNRPFNMDGTFQNQQDDETEEEMLLPHSEVGKYTWDSLVFLIPAILRKQKIFGKNAYRKENKPVWWPEGVPFCSPNIKSKDGHRLSVKEMREILNSFLSDCKNEYTICENVTAEESAAEIGEDSSPEDNLTAEESAAEIGKDSSPENILTAEESAAEIGEDSSPENILTAEESAAEIGKDSSPEDNLEKNQVDLVVKYIKKLWSEPNQQAENCLMTTSMGIRINLDAFTMLKDRVSDEFLDAYMLSLLRESEAPYLYINCASMTLLFHPKMQSTVTGFQPSPKMIGVYNLGRRHWVLIEICYDSKYITVIDPLGELQSTLNSLTRNWRTFVGKNDWKVNVVPHSKQQDSTSCGIFCLMFAERFLKKETLDVASDPEHVHNYRLKVLKKVVENQDEDTMKKLCRLCRNEKYKGKKVAETEWVSCELCGLFRVNVTCSKRSTSPANFVQRNWRCCVCAS